MVIRPRTDGRLEVVTGFTEMGQGLFTILTQVIAHETGIDPEYTQNGLLILDMDESDEAAHDSHRP